VDPVGLHGDGVTGFDDDLAPPDERAVTRVSCSSAQVKLVTLAALNTGDDGPSIAVIRWCIVLVGRSRVDVERVAAVLLLVNERRALHRIIFRDRQVFERK